MMCRESIGVDMLAQNTIKKYDAKLLKSDPDEIPIEEIIEFGFGLKLVFTDLCRNGMIMGVTVFEDCVVPVYDLVTGKYKSKMVCAGSILIDNSLLEDEQKLRFTMAHELAHWLIHYCYYYNNNESASRVRINSKSENKSIEEEADELARSLLLPRGRLKVAFDRTKCKFKKEVAVQIIADTFNVSVEDVMLRLTNLNLIK